MYYLLSKVKSMCIFVKEFTTVYPSILIEKTSILEKTDKLTIKLTVFLTFRKPLFRGFHFSYNYFYYFITSSAFFIKASSSFMLSKYPSALKSCRAIDDFKIF